MDKYEAIRQYKAARKAANDTLAAFRLAEQAKNDADLAFRKAHEVVAAHIIGEAVIFEGEAWTKDQYGRVHAHKIG